MDVFVVKPVNLGRGVVEVLTAGLLPPSSADEVNKASKDTSERAVSGLSGSRCEEGAVGRLSEFR
jgi:hypothetical protein